MSRQKTIAPKSDIWARIETKQTELHALYEEAAEGIFKNTEGESFLGEKNMAYAQYWLSAVKKSPKAVTGDFDFPDFDVKTNLFSAFIAAYNAHNAAGAVLDTPYNILSKDVFRYASDAKKAFEVSSDPVRKQAVKDAPSYRKSSISKKDDNNGDNAADKPSDETPK